MNKELSIELLFLDFKIIIFCVKMDKKYLNSNDAHFDIFYDARVSMIFFSRYSVENFFERKCETS